MRIGIEAQRIYKIARHGIEIVNLELIKHLQDFDKSNEYVVFVKDGPDKEVLQESGNLELRILKRLPYPLWEQWLLPLAAEKENLDILHCTGNTSPLRLSIPLVLTLHDLFFIEETHFKGTPYQNFGNLYRNIIVRAVQTRANRIITVSNEQKNRILAKFPDAAGRISVVYNGVGKEFSIPKEEQDLDEIRRKYGLPAKFNLYLGNMDPRKNAANTIKAYLIYNQKSNSAIPLVAPGLPAGWIRKFLKKEGGSSKQELFLTPGYIDPHDLAGVYQLAELLLIPSFKEGFGLPILEAMASGTPVITSNISSMPETAANAAILVDPSRPEKIARALIQLNMDSDLYETMKVRGRKRALMFPWEKTVAGVKKVYESLQKGPQS